MDNNILERVKEAKLSQLWKQPRYLYFPRSRPKAICKVFLNWFSLRKNYAAFVQRLTIPNSFICIYSTAITSVVIAFISSWDSFHLNSFYNLLISNKQLATIFIVKSKDNKNFKQLFFEKLQEQVKKRIEEQNIVLAKPVKMQQKLSPKLVVTSKISPQKEELIEQLEKGNEFVIEEDYNNIISCYVKKNNPTAKR